MVVNSCIDKPNFLEIEIKFPKYSSLTNYQKLNNDSKTSFFVFPSFFNNRSSIIDFNDFLFEFSVNLLNS